MIRDASQTVKIEQLSRNIKDRDIKKFETDLKHKIELPHKNDNIHDMYQNYLKNIISIMDKQTSITRRQLTKRNHKTWYDRYALKLNIQRRKAEKTWHNMQLESNKKHYLHVNKC